MSTRKRIFAKSIPWTSPVRIQAGEDLLNLSTRVTGFLCRAAREIRFGERLSQKRTQQGRGGRQQPGALAYRKAKCHLEILAEPQFAHLQLLVRPRIEETVLPRLLVRAEALVKSRNWAKLAPLEPALQEELRRLERRLYEGHRELIPPEKEAMLGAVQMSLSQLHYQVSQTETRHGRVIRGERGEESFYGTISPEAELTIDFAGFHGRTCQQAFQELADKLRNNGVDIEVQEEEFHGKPEGGYLVRELKQELAVVLNPLRSPAAPKRRSARPLLV
jgi:hypothetical protein